MQLMLQLLSLHGASFNGGTSNLVSIGDSSNEVSSDARVQGWLLNAQLFWNN